MVCLFVILTDAVGLFPKGFLIAYNKLLGGISGTAGHL